MLHGGAKPASVCRGTVLLPDRRGSRAPALRSGRKGLGRLLCLRLPARARLAWGQRPTRFAEPGFAEARRPQAAARAGRALQDHGRAHAGGRPCRRASGTALGKGWYSRSFPDWPPECLERQEAHLYLNARVILYEVVVVGTARAVVPISAPGPLLRSRSRRHGQEPQTLLPRPVGGLNVPGGSGESLGSQGEAAGLQARKGRLLGAVNTPAE